MSTISKGREIRQGWLKEDKQDIGLKMLLFLVSPFLAFVYSLRRIKTKSSFIIFFLFSCFFGLSFTVGKIRYEGSIDGISYRIDFENYRHLSFSQYTKGLTNLISFRGDKQDYYFDTVAFYVSRITGNYHILFLILAMIFAFFQLKALKFFTSEKEFDNSIICLILIFLFTYNQIFNINGVRYWTASWVGIYSIFQIFGKGNKRYFLLAFATPFFHGAFWVFLVIILVAHFFREFERFWIILFFFSFIVSNYATELIGNFGDYLPYFLRGWAISYASHDTIMRANQEGTGYWWVSKVFEIFVRVYINLLVYLFIKNSNLVKRQSPQSKSMYLFLLVWMTFANFTMPVPSLGSRLMILSFPVVAYLWLINFKKNKYRILIYLMPIVFFMNIYKLFILYNTVLDPFFYFSSPIVLVYKYLMF